MNKEKLEQIYNWLDSLENRLDSLFQVCEKPLAEYASITEGFAEEVEYIKSVPDTVKGLKEIIEKEIDGLTSSNSEPLNKQAS